MLCSAAEFASTGTFSVTAAYPSSTGKVCYAYSFLLYFFIDFLIVSNHKWYIFQLETLELISCRNTNTFFSFIV